MRPVPLPLPRPNVDWRTECLAGDESIYGYLVGRPFGAYTHYNLTRKASKPCRWAMANETLPCLLCATSKPRWIAYAPFLVGEECKRRFYILSKTVAAGVNQEHMMQPLKLHRPPGKGQKYQLTHATEKDVGARLMSFTEPLDDDSIARYLFHLWGDEQLAEYHGYHLPKVTPAPEDLRVKNKSKKDETKPTTKRIVTPRELLAHVASGMALPAE